jgi:hypothetical protein
MHALRRGDVRGFYGTPKPESKAAPKGASDFAGVTIPLKRYPDTKLVESMLGDSMLADSMLVDAKLGDSMLVDSKLVESKVGRDGRP